jgi:hypothetical protein
MTAFAGKLRLADNSAYPDQRITSEEESMCPLCLTTAALIAGSVTSTGGLAALVIKKFGSGTFVDNNPAQPDQTSFDKKTEQ